MSGFESRGETIKSEEDQIRTTKLLRLRRKILLVAGVIVATYAVWKIVGVLVSGALAVAGI